MLMSRIAYPLASHDIMFDMMMYRYDVIKEPSASRQQPPAASVRHQVDSNQEKRQVDSNQEKRPAEEQKRASS